MTLYEFYGEECPHCEAMEDKVERLQEQEDVEVEQLEVWHDEDNAAKLEGLDDGKCGGVLENRRFSADAQTAEQFGVPFFINTETSDWICGEAPYDELVEWATGAS
ncbi:MAG: hypothetical protein ABEK00_03710 [Candidatus Nanohaloarchaea archaeon]